MQQVCCLQLVEDARLPVPQPPSPNGRPPRATAAVAAAAAGASSFPFPGGTPYGNGVGVSPSSNFNPFNSPFGPQFNTSPMVPPMNLEDWWNGGAALAQQFQGDEEPMFGDQPEWP